MAALLVGCGDNNEVTSGVPVSQQSGATATAWFALQLVLVRETPGFSPPVASRAFAYSGITLYESVVNGMRDFKSLGRVLTVMPEMPAIDLDGNYYWPASANAALAQISRDMFPNASAENLAAIDELEARLAAAYVEKAGRETLDRSAKYGRAVAAAIFKWSTTDGGHEGFSRNFPAGYAPPMGAGLWVPTPPMFQPALQPFWGDNRPFLSPDNGQCDFGMPPPFSTQPGSEFYVEAKEVFDAVNNLTPEQKEIALFWADEAMKTATPPGHSIAIATQLLDADNASLAVAAETYAKLGIAVSDAFISCWKMKFQFNLIRPISYNRLVFDAMWSSFIVTPPFPEYPSGHSAQSGAGSEVMTAMFGEVGFTDHTNDYRGIAPRSFDSFADAANEAAISRLYGGIHYRSAIEDGLTMGACIGDRVNALPFREAVDSDGDFDGD
ncbi:MAG TPA: vanadium-dependent haloperoxidase [Kofleriaceae bacterium]|nr:vanadium-dependent haloperoxidase [Kofleriaceae bacterium]